LHDASEKAIAQAIIKFVLFIILNFWFVYDHQSILLKYKVIFKIDKPTIFANDSEF